MKRILIVAALSVFSCTLVAHDLQINYVKYTSTEHRSAVSASGRSLKGVFDINDSISFSVAYEALSGNIGDANIHGNNQTFGALYQVPFDDIFTLQVGISRLKSNLRFKDATSEVAKEVEGEVLIDGMKGSTDLVVGTAFHINSNIDTLVQLNIPTDGGGGSSTTLGAKYNFSYSSPLFGSYIHLRRYMAGDTVGTIVGVGASF